MRRRMRVVLAVVPMLLLVVSGPAQPQTSEEMLRSLQRDLESLKQGQDRVQKDVEEIKAILQRVTRGGGDEVKPENVVLDLKDGQRKGDAGARLVMVEFSDYQCPFCGRHFRDTLPTIDTEYVRTGKMQYIARDFPLEAIHPQAFKAAEAAQCAAEQGKFWEMHNRLFTNQRQLAPADLSAHARALALDGAKFDECLNSGRHAAGVRKDLADGEKAGVRGTPTMFLAVRQGNETRLRVLGAIQGAQPLATVKDAIEKALQAAAAR